VKHATSISSLGLDAVEQILSTARAWKQHAPGNHLAGKILAMLFFNPSLRTRASFEAAMLRGGGHAIVLEAGSGTWKLEDRAGAIMDGDRPEHLKDAIPVLSRYADALAVRTFATGADDAADHADNIIRAIAEYATVPVVSMESAREHPCQGLADLLTIEEQFGTAKNLPVTLTWAPHIKPLPKAVPNSFLLTAAARGCDIRVAHPAGFELDAGVIAEAQQYGGSIRFFNNQEQALQDSRVVYAKAWGPATAAALPPDAVRQHGDWMITADHLARAAADAIFLHCLPVRRNVEIADAVLDGPQSRVTDQAENRFHVQRALLEWLLN
jgi:N-acetylornithine carbamoyltransferase